MSQTDPFARAEKKKTKDEGEPFWFSLNGGANGTTSKQPIRFEQTLNAEFTIVNTQFKCLTVLIDP